MKELKKFEEKFGFKAYEEIKKFMGSLVQKIEELKLSRENWKNKYMKLKEKIKNVKGNQ